MDIFDYVCFNAKIVRAKIRSAFYLADFGYQILRTSPKPQYNKSTQNNKTPKDKKAKSILDFLSHHFAINS